MLEWILVISQLALWGAVIQLHRLRRRDATLQEEYRTAEELGSGVWGLETGPTQFGPQTPTRNPQPPDGWEGLTARLERIAERLDAEAATKAAAVRGVLGDLEGRGDHMADHMARQGLSALPQGSGGRSPAEEVIALKRAGLTLKEIAQRTGRGEQEIELALRLQRPRQRSAS